MPRANYCDISVVLDRSGSMISLREAAVTAFNNFVEDQRKTPGDGCWSLIQFDNKYETVFSQVSQNAVQPLTAITFVPRGSTAMHGAIGRTIDETGKRLAALPESSRPDKVLIVILTDGKENWSDKEEWSKEYTQSVVAEKIEHQRNVYGWKFIYLGANQDAVTTAKHYKIPTCAAFTYEATNRGIIGAMNLASTGTRNWKLEGNDSAADLLIEPKNEVAVNVKS